MPEDVLRDKISFMTQQNQLSGTLEFHHAPRLFPEILAQSKTVEW